MKKRLLVAAVGLPTLIIITCVLPSWGLAILGTVLVVGGAFELVRCRKAGSVKRVYAYTMVSAAAVFFPALWGLSGHAAETALFVLGLMLFAEAVFTRGKEKSVSFEDLLVSLFGGIALPYLFSFMVSLRCMEYGSAAVMLAFAITFISDAGAMLFGKCFGKRHPLPHVSPNKSVAGFIGSLGSCVAAVLLFGLATRYVFHIPTSFAALLCYVIPCNLTVQLGDLAFSLIKRESGIKDFSNVFPGHGGMLDRMDSFFFTFGTLYALMGLMPAFG